MRKKMNSNVQHQFAYAHTAFASDTAIRHWYFASDSAFAYHPDSGLRTFSGRLLGWESSVSHKLEQHTVDSASNFQYSAKELTRDSHNIWTIGYIFWASLGAMLVVFFFVVRRR
ncbi:hypothetical protein C5749_14870 [Sphingobacterium gobiense]|uniref:Uncharacterized protein n=2 Tax=Sphingobacterium gobiense TaxID=1382456 RepID=A0A2S9JNI5_9SPHI|nr:hypothetical protein C5749_14870 [Sphingobacterium gobiense]